MFKTFQKMNRKSQKFPENVIKSTRRDRFKMTSKNAPKNRVFLQNFYANLQRPNFAEISQKWYALSFNDAKVPFFAENSEILLQNMYMDIKKNLDI